MCDSRCRVHRLVALADDIQGADVVDDVEHRRLNMRKKKNEKETAFIPSTDFMPPKEREYRIRLANIMGADLYVRADRIFVRGDFVEFYTAGQTTAIIQTSAIEYVVAELDEMEVDE